MVEYTPFKPPEYLITFSIFVLFEQIGMFLNKDL